jgi:hypothetical protein
MRLSLSLEELERAHEAGVHLTKHLWAAEGTLNALHRARLPPIVATPIQLPYDGHEGWFGECPNGVIKISVPVKGARDGPPGWFTKHGSRITGLIAHEWTHIKQKHDRASSYLRDLNTWKMIRTNLCEPDLYIPYYSLRSEQQAHGVQAAAEMWLDRKKFGATFCWKHIRLRTGEAGLPRRIESGIRKFAFECHVRWLADAYGGQ